MTYHPCPGGCGAAVPRTKLSCRACWYRLPKPLRDDIEDAYRLRFYGGGLAHAQALAAASRWYRANPT